MGAAREAAVWRREASAARVPSRGQTAGHATKAYAVSALWLAPIPEIKSE